MSDVDVLVPCYNYGRFLRRCVDSVLDQQGVNVRVLIIDDASTDDTSDIGEAFARSDSRVEFRRHAANQGHIATYNEGLLGWSASEYSLLLAADDMLAPGALARAAHVMDRHRDVGLTYGMALVISGDAGADAAPDESSTDYRIIAGAEFLRRCFEKGNAVETCTAVVRTAVQQRLGGYLPHLPHSGDMEMWMRFAVHGPVGVIRSVQGYVRKHGANMSNQYYGQRLRDWREIVQACDQILAQSSSQFPESGLWRQAMLKRMGEESCKVASRAFDRGDLAACQTCLDFAAEIHPPIRGSKAWRRVVLKKAVGPAIWNTIRPLWIRVRTGRAATPEPFVQPRLPHLSGWWPETL